MSSAEPAAHGHAEASTHRNARALAIASMTLTDARAAEAALQPYFPTLRLGTAAAAEFRTRLRATSASRFSLAEYSFGSPGRAAAGSDDVVIVESSGRSYAVEHRGRRVDVSRPYHAPPEGLSATWETVAARAISLDHAAVLRFARNAAGDPDLQLQRSVIAPVSAEAARYWQSTARGLRDALAAAPDAYDSPIVAEAAFRRLAVAYLFAFPIGYAERVQRGASTASSRAVARAVEYLREHAGEPVSVADAAAAASLSVRGLHAAFVRELGEPPSETLRRIRLGGARADLLAAPPGASATAIAQRWGFAHRARFADAYRRAYGELPRQTLAR